MSPELVAAIRAGAVNLVGELIAEECASIRKNRDEWRTLAFTVTDNETVLRKRLIVAEGALREARSYLQQCAVLRMEPNKHKIRELLSTQV